MTGAGLRWRGRARPGGWPLLDPLLDRELRRSYGSGALHRRLHSTSSSWCGRRRLMRSCGPRRPQRVVDDTCSCCSTHGFRHNSKYSGGQLEALILSLDVGLFVHKNYEVVSSCSLYLCRYLTALLNLLGFEQQLSLGECSVSMWIT